MAKKFRDFCVIHENHENIRPRKFGAIRYMKTVTLLMVLLSGDENVPCRCVRTMRL